MEFFNLDQLINLAYVALAMVLGAAIGLERETAEKPAGLRTHMLAAGVGVCVGLLQFTLAIGVTILALITLRAVPVIERRLGQAQE